jgi:hypothetical protein
MNNTERTALDFTGAVNGFIDLLYEATLDYEWNKRELSRLDALTQEYLTKMDAKNITGYELAVINRKLNECRKLRRETLETIETLTPFMTAVYKWGGHPGNDVSWRLHNALKFCLLPGAEGSEKTALDNAYRRRPNEVTDGQ